MMMRARSRWMMIGAAFLCLVLAACDSSTNITTTPTTAAATATATTPPTPTATAIPVAKNVYYASDDGNIYALNVTNGSVRWTFTKGSGAVEPILVEKYVYIATLARSTGAQTVFALDSTTGAVVWSASGGVSLTAANGALYFFEDGLGVARTLVSLDALTGATHWKTTIPSGLLFIASDTIYAVSVTLNSTGAATSSTVTALNTADGSVRWSFTRPNEGFEFSQVDDGGIYFASRSYADLDAKPVAQLYALKAQDGSQRWKVAMPGLVTVSALSESTYFVYSFGLALNAYSTADGKLLWSHNEQNLGRISVVGKTSYANRTGINPIFAMDATTGHQIWSTNYYGAYRPLVTNGVVYNVSGGDSGLVLALNTQTGKVIWQKGAPHASGPLVVSGNTLYAYSIEPSIGGTPVTTSPVVYAYNAATGAILWTHQTKVNLDHLAVTDGVSGA